MGMPLVAGRRGLSTKDFDLLGGWWLEDGELSCGLADRNPLGFFWVGLPPLTPFSLDALILDSARLISLSTREQWNPSVSLRKNSESILAVALRVYLVCVLAMRLASSNEAMGFSVE